MRASSAVSGLTALLAACGQPAPEEPAPRLPHIACAHAGQPLRADCTVEKEGAILLVRHPDGAFRRLAITDTGFVTADGAASASRAADGTLTVAGDRYRFPEDAR